MKKSLVLLVVLVASVAVAGSASAYYGWGCYDMPKCKIVCKDQVLCKGAASGTIYPCGPAVCTGGGCCKPGKIVCPSICFAGSWVTLLKCPKPKGGKKAGAGWSLKCPQPCTFTQVSNCCPK
jgi:hypothetical protein